MYLPYPCRFNRYIADDAPMLVRLIPNTRNNLLKVWETETFAPQEIPEAIEIPLAQAERECSARINQSLIHDFQTWLQQQRSGPPTRALDGRKQVAVIGGGLCGALAAQRIS